MRDAAHWRPSRQATVFAGQRQLQLPRNRQRIIKKHFIKITQTEEYNISVILVFYIQILLHHR